MTKQRDKSITPEPIQKMVAEYKGKRFVLDEVIGRSLEMVEVTP